MKSVINQQFDKIISIAISDLKLFAKVHEEIQNMKESDMSKINCVRFIIFGAILAQRLKFNNFALEFYEKAMKHSFSLFCFKNMISLHLKEKNAHEALNLLFCLIDSIKKSELNLEMKIPNWIEGCYARIRSKVTIEEVNAQMLDFEVKVFEYMSMLEKRYKSFKENIEQYF